MGLVLTPQSLLRMLRTLGKWLLFICGWKTEPAKLHNARFATKRELAAFQTPTLPTTSLLLGTAQHHRPIAVHPTPRRKELGNTLVVGPTRSGKGLLAISQLLSWKHSAIVNDPKGSELFQATAGYRATLGPVFVIDPTGVGHRYDPLKERQTDEDLLSAAASLLMRPDEGDGAVFTERAVVMLRQLFLAARKQQVAPLPFVRQMIYLTLPRAAVWLHTIDPRLTARFLDCPYEQADFANKYLLSAWSVLSNRMEFVLTENLIRTLSGADFSAADILLAPKPVTVYLRWKERDLLTQAPLIRLMWDSLIGELITTHDARKGAGCRPVLLLLDEAARTAVPSLAEYASTIVGRNLTLFIAVQSLAQLETVYGESRAETLRDNADSQIFYRPVNLATAEYLEKRIGTVSAFAKSMSYRDGEEVGEGRAERPIALLSAQDILQLPETDVLAFHTGMPPLRLTRMDWRQHPELVQRHDLAPPDLPVLPPVPETSLPQLHWAKTSGYLDIDKRN